MWQHLSQCQLVNIDTDEKAKVNGVVFPKRDFTLLDLLNYRAASTSHQQHYQFDDEQNLTITPLAIRNFSYDNPRYLEQRGYGDYLDIPIRTKLREKALSGDDKALFVYSLYWSHLSFLDPHSDAPQWLENTLMLTLKRNNKNSDALAYLGALAKDQSSYKNAHELFQYDQSTLDDLPFAQYKYAFVLLPQASLESKKAAFNAFEKAALAGFAPAQYDYGLMLYQAEAGIEENKVKGENYIALSAAGGFPYALEHFEQCSAPTPKIEGNKLVYTPCE